MEESVEKLPVEIELGESNPFNQLPIWSCWLSTIVLSLAFFIGLPLNGATVLVFCRRKKPAIRHLVNFVLILDCSSHIALCLICVPIHIVSVWSNRSLATGLSVLQQVVGNFSNVYSTFLAVSIAILRYRRLCWRKKDKFSTANAVKWSFLTGSLAVALTFAQSYCIFLSDDQKTKSVSYIAKISIIVLSMAIIVFCYIRVSKRVWANATNQEKVMDPIKLKKSRSVHLRATIHSCVQIILVIATFSPHLYQQTLELEGISSPSLSPQYAQPNLSTEENQYQVPTLHALLLEDLGSSGEENTSRSQQIFSTQEDPSSPQITGSHLAQLIGITINYALLILGTPIAYIASCHRFREQFTSILFSNIINSPQNSGCNNMHSPRHQPRNQLSSCSGLRGCRSHSPYPQGNSPGRMFSHTSGRPFSSSITAKTIVTSGTTSGANGRNSISLSVNNASTTVTISRGNGSVKSRSSLKRPSTKRKGSRGLLGADFIIVDSESTNILQDQDLSQSTNPKETPTPSPTMTDGNNGRNEGRNGSIFDLEAIYATRIEAVGGTQSLQTILQNYGYDYSDFGDLV